MLDRKCREMGIRDEIAHSLAGDKQALEKSPVTLRWPHDPNVRLIEPALDSSNCLFHVQWSFEYLSAGGDAHESKNHGPAQAHGIGAAELSIPPLAGLLVSGAPRIFSVQD